MKRLLLALVSAAMIFCLFSCSGNGTAYDGPAKLSFKAALSYDYLSSLNGKQVTINGYMATASPVDGSYIYLMNMPYQSCPFCKPNTSELSNTMAVYPKSREKFDYTEQAITVTGTLMVSGENELFSDPYGYEFSFKITDADYRIMTSEEMSESTRLWQEFSRSGMTSELANMYEYVNFLCSWNTYYCNSGMDDEGNYLPGYYLYPSDAEYFIKTEGAQYNYGYQEGYFDGIIDRLKKLGEKDLSDLISNVERAKALAAKALDELENGNYTYEKQYVEMFDNEDFVYTLDSEEELMTEMDLLYYEYSLWLAGYEM